jgi:DNA-3-methyladenine glycosylase I
MNNSGIIRNKLKIEAAITNAGAFIKVCEKFGSFDTYIWQFADGKPLNSKCDNHSNIPAKSPVSDKMSKDLIKLGFKFTGSTICYAYMQASGMVNDHLVSCFRYNELIQLK